MMNFYKNWIFIKKPQGQMLLVLIVTMTILAVLGAGMLYFSTSSLYTELFVNNHAKAKYLAKSGINYAGQVITSGNYSNSKYCNGGIVTPQTVTLSGGNKFQLSICSCSFCSSCKGNTAFCPTGIPYYIESVGIANPDNWLESKTKIIQQYSPSQQNLAIRAASSASRSSSVVGTVNGDVVVYNSGALDNKGTINGNIIYDTSIPTPTLSLVTVPIPTTKMDNTTALLTSTSSPYYYNTNVSPQNAIRVNGNVEVVAQGNATLNATKAITISPASSLTIYSPNAITIAANVTATSSDSILMIYGTNTTAGKTAIKIQTGAQASWCSVYAPMEAVSLTAGSTKLMGTLVGYTVDVLAGTTATYSSNIPNTTTITY